MSVVIIIKGPDSGRSFPLQDGRTTLGRNPDCHIPLSGKQVSRHHAQVFHRDNQFNIQDLGSSNGTFVNGQRLTPSVPVVLTEHDTFQVGPYLLALRLAVAPVTELDNDEPSVVVRETVNATSWDERLVAQDPAMKLQVVLEIAQHLARTLELDPLLDKLLEHLMKLLPQADRLMVILCDEDKLILRAQRTRQERDYSNMSFSRSIVKRALDEGIGLISEDLQTDKNIAPSHSITSLDLHSMICVPMITQEGRRLGVLQVERFGQGYGFQVDDLHLLTAISMEVTLVLENVTLHAEKLREQRLMQELALAQEIQQGYLPDELEGFPNADFEIFGRVYPARQVAGDFYDFNKGPAGKLALFIGDVSGKGMPAALFMIAVRTLCRHLAKESERPGQLLARLNTELGDDNASCMFVTLAHGIYDPASGQIVLASAGHPAPFLRRADGTVETVAIKPGRLLGYNDGKILEFSEASISLNRGDALFFFTDGFFEPRAAKRQEMFGQERIKELIRAWTPDRPLAECTSAAKQAIDRFTGAKELQDDLTLLILRRKPS